MQHPQRPASRRISDRKAALSTTETTERRYFAYTASNLVIYQYSPCSEGQQAATATRTPSTCNIEIHNNAATEKQNRRVQKVVLVVVLEI